MTTGSNNRGVDSQSRRTFLRGAGGLLGTGAVVGLSGCTGQSGSGSEDGGTTQKSTSSSLQHTKIAAAHYPLVPESTGTLTGKKKGMFNDHGVAIDSVTSFGGGGTTVRGVVTGGLAAGKTALMGAVKAFRAGAPLRIVGLMTTSNYIEFEVKPDSEIETIQDLKGKKIALSNPGSSSQAVALKSLENADGIGVDDVEFLFAGGLGEAIVAMQQGEADATFNVLPKSTAMRAQDKVRAVWKGDEYAPNVTEHIMIMGSSFVDSKPEVAKGIARGHAEAMQYVGENPDEVAEMWANAAGLPKDITSKAMEETNPAETFQIGLKEDVLKTTAEAMVLQGLIDEQPAWDKILDQSVFSEENRVDWV